MERVLSDGVFGPLGPVITATNEAEMVAPAASYEGQLTASLDMDAEDLALACCLMSILGRKAGPVLVNGYPTGVEVADAMVYCAPYPASTNFGATRVGTLSIRRFLRPVCCQNVPAALRSDDIA